MIVFSAYVYVCTILLISVALTPLLAEGSRLYYTNRRIVSAIHVVRQSFFILYNLFL